MKVESLRRFADPDLARASAQPQADAGIFSNPGKEAGRGLYKLGEAIGDMVVDKEREDGAVLAAQKMAELRQQSADDAAEAQSNLRVDNSKGTYDVVVDTGDESQETGAQPLSKYLEQKYQERVDAALGTVSNKYALKTLQAHAAAYKASVYGSAVHMEASARHVARMDGLEQVVDLNANQVRNNPALLDELLAQTTDAIKAAKLGPDEAKLIDGMQSSFAHSAMKGMISSDWRTAQRILTDAKDPANDKFMRMLRPNQREELLSAINTQERVERAELRASVSQDLTDHLASLSTFGTGLPGFDRLFRSAYGDDARALAAFDRRETLAKQTFTVSQKIKGASVQEIPGIIDSIVPKQAAPGAHDALQNAAQLQNIAAAHIRALHQDPVGTVKQLFADELEGLDGPAKIARVLELQRQKGIPSPQVFSKAELDTFSQLVQSENPMQVVQTVNQLVKDTEGLYAPVNGDLRPVRSIAFAQLAAGSDGLPPVYQALIGAVEDGQTVLANDLARTLSRRKDGLTSALVNKDQDVKTIKQTLDTELARWKTSAAMGGVERASGIKAIEDAAFDLALSKTFDGLSPDAAAQAAAKQLVLNRYARIRDGVAVPTHVPGYDGPLDPTQVFSHLNVMRERFSRDPQARGLVSATLSRMPSYATDKLKDVVYDAAIASGRWVNNNDNTGVNFQIPLRDGSYIPLRQRDGSLFELSFAQAMQPLPKAIADRYEDDSTMNMVERYVKYYPGLESEIRRDPKKFLREKAGGLPLPARRPVED